MTVQEMLKEFISAHNYGKDDVFTKQDIIEWFKEFHSETNKGTLNCQIVLASTNNRNRIHYSVTAKHDLFFQISQNKFRLYNPNEDEMPIYKKSKSDGMTENVRNSAANEISDDDSDDEIEREFVYEKDLQLFLSKNLDIIGKDLKLYQDIESNINGLEVNVGRRFIDMLLLDSENNFIVVELKVSRSYDKVLGQILRYMGWIRQNFAENGQRVSGIIIGRKISEDLIIAASEVQNISLMEYSIDVKLKAIK